METVESIFKNFSFDNIKSNNFFFIFRIQEYFVPLWKYYRINGGSNNGKIQIHQTFASNSFILERSNYSRDQVDYFSIRLGMDIIFGLFQSVFYLILKLMDPK